MIDKITGFRIGAADPVDSRLVMTKEEMKVAGTKNNTKMPDVYLAMCKDDGKLYVYNVANPVDPEIGKFKLHESGGKVDPTYDPDEQTLIF